MGLRERFKIDSECLKEIVRFSTYSLIHLFQGKTRLVMLLGAFFVLVGILMLAPAPFLTFLPQRLVFTDVVACCSGSLFKDLKQSRRQRDLKITLAFSE